MIGILDYGVGNLVSVFNGLRYFSPDKDIRIITTPNELSDCEKIVLPGVGAFTDARKLLEESGLDEQLLIEAEKGKPILGICLGMQLMATRSFEGKETLGLGLIPGDVVRFERNDVKVPHMGWNGVRQEMSNALFKNLENEADFYFVHSYHYQCANQHNVLATTQYGIRFTSAVQHDNIIGIQFHPEKSQRNGLLLLKNFVELLDG